MALTPRIGWVGVGKMGAPMGRRVLEAGFRLAVLDPVPAHVAPLVADGAVRADGPRMLAAESDVICLTIPNDAALHAAVLSADGLLPHLTDRHRLVDLSTVSPAASAEVAAALASRRIGYLRAPVSGSTATASAGRLTVLASGPTETYEACLPLLESFAARTFHLGEGEEARFMKLALNTMVAATAGFMGEAVALGRRGNIPMDAMLDVILDSVVASPLIAYKRDLVLEGGYAPQFSIEQMLKDLGLAAEEARRGGIQLPLLALLMERFETVRAAGEGELDFFALLDR